MAKTGRLLIAHEAVRPFGAGAEIAATVSEELFGKLKAPVRRVGAPFCPVPFSSALESAFAVDRNDIVPIARSFMQSTSEKVLELS